jgi:hypothetical protein
MEKRETDKSETRTVSLPLSMWEEVERRAAENFGGKRSSYIRALVSGDLGPRADVCRIGDKIIVDLIRHYRPAMFDDAEMILADVNQQRLMDSLIGQISSAICDGDGVDPSQIVILSQYAYQELLHSCSREEIEKLACRPSGFGRISLGGGTSKHASENASQAKRSPKSARPDAP